MNYIVAYSSIHLFIHCINDSLKHSLTNMWAPIFAKLYYSYCGYISKQGQKFLFPEGYSLAGETNDHGKYLKY